MPRTKRIADTDVLEAAGEIVSSGGPDALTFAAVGARSGLSPATLVQRFGTREGMMRATLLGLWDRLDATTAAADAKLPVTPEGAMALLLRLSAGYGDTPDETAQGLLVLREDFRDPVLRARGVAWGNALTAALGRRLAGEPARQAQLGRLMASQWQGALLWWAFSRKVSLRSYLRNELKTWLAALD